MICGRRRVERPYDAIAWGHLSCERGLSPPYMISDMLQRKGRGMGQRNGGKLATTRKTRSIPACKAEIGNWAVVITGCGIDVVPINQNCWINKNCSRFFFFFFPLFFFFNHGGVQKMFQSLSSSISRNVPIFTAMIRQIRACVREFFAFWTNI